MTAYLDPTGIVSHDGWFHNGQAWKTPCRMASTANLTLSGLQTIDGVVGVAGDRVLAKNQSTGSQNGIYFMRSGAWERAYDMDQDQTTDVKSEEIGGAFVYVVSGTANAGKLFHTTNALGGTLGSTAIVWAEFSPTTSLALDDLTDVTITSVANANRLRYDSSASLWKNSALVWEPMIASDGSVMTDGLLNPMQHEVPY